MATFSLRNARLPRPFVCNLFAEQLAPAMPPSRVCASVLVRSWALQASNLRPPPCKSGRGVSEGAGQYVETLADLRERVSLTCRQVPVCRGTSRTSDGLETDCDSPVIIRSGRDQIASPPPLSFFSLSLSISTVASDSPSSTAISNDPSNAHTGAHPASRPIGAPEVPIGRAWQLSSADILCARSVRSVGAPIGSSGARTRRPAT